MNKQLSTKLFKKISSIKVFGLKTKELIVLASLVIIASISQSWHFLVTARLGERGIQFSQLHDSLWHLSLIKELSRAFPPQHPGLAGVALSNYHYLSDLTLMVLTKLSGLSAETVYFHVAPPIVAGLFALSVFSLTKRLSKSHWIAITSIAFTVFGGSAAYLIPFLLGKETLWFANSFMLDQPFDQLTNVHTVLGFAMFLFAASFLHRYLEEGRKKDAWLAGILFGLSTGVKAYAGAVGIAALIITSAYEITIRKRLKTLLPAGIAAGIFIALTFMTSKTSKAPLEFLPGWILDKMVEDSGRFYNEQLIQLKQHYQAAGNVFRLIQINIEKLALYIIGNLGVRVLSFVWILKKLVRIHRTKLIEVFLIAAIATSLITPLLFVQPVSVYNTIQFSPYALMLTSILLVVWAGQKNKSVIILLLLFLLSIPTTIKTIVLRKEDSQSISIAEYRALYSLRKLPEDAVVLTASESDHRYLMKVPGLGERRTYFSGETFAVLTDVSFEERLKKQEEFFAVKTPEDKKKNILEDAKITHIYSDIRRDSEMLKKLERVGFPIKLIFENEAATVFQVI